MLDIGLSTHPSNGVSVSLTQLLTFRGRLYHPKVDLEAEDRVQRLRAIGSSNQTPQRALVYVRAGCDHVWKDAWHRRCEGVDWHRGL